MNIDPNSLEWMKQRVHEFSEGDPEELLLLDLSELNLFISSLLGSRADDPEVKAAIMELLPYFTKQNVINIVYKEPEEFGPRTHYKIATRVTGGRFILVKKAFVYFALLAGVAISQPAIKPIMDTIGVPQVAQDTINLAIEAAPGTAIGILFVPKEKKDE